MPKLTDFIGKNVLLSIVGSSKTQGYEVTLVGVEAGGLWVESDELQQLAPQVVPKRRDSFFFPYAQVVFVLPIPAR